MAVSSAGVGSTEKLSCFHNLLFGFPRKTKIIWEVDHASRR